MTAPEKIWLQIHPDDIDSEDSYFKVEATWCGTKIDDTDIEYVRADLSLCVEYRRCLKCGEAEDAPDKEG